MFIKERHFPSPDFECVRGGVGGWGGWGLHEFLSKFAQRPRQRGRALAPKTEDIFETWPFPPVFLVTVQFHVVTIFHAPCRQENNCGEMIGSRSLSQVSLRAVSDVGKRTPG